jgi:Trypsin-like peptidase domain
VNEWTWPTARFRHAATKANIGTGVLVAGDVVLTCEHVVRAVLTGSGAKPEIGAAFVIDFPLAGIFDLPAKVAKLFPEIPESERRQDSASSDLAVLTLDKPEMVERIEPCLIAETDPPADTDFSCQGFPAADPNGDLAEGSVQGRDAGGWITVVGKSQFGHFVEPGFSGGPVFCRKGPIGPSWRGHRALRHRRHQRNACGAADPSGTARRRHPIS